MALDVRKNNMTPIKKKPKTKKPKQPGFMSHIKPSAPTGKGLGKPKIRMM